MKKSLFLKHYVLLLYLLTPTLFFLCSNIFPSYGENTPLPDVIRDRQAQPNSDRFPQQLPIPQSLPAKPSLELTPTPERPTELVPAKQSIQVTTVKVIGSSIFSKKQLDPLVQKIQGRTVSIAEINQVADQITQLYINAGYITSRAVFVNQDAVNGIVEIRVIEGSLSKIEILGTRRLSLAYIRSRISLGVSKPLNTNQLEDKLRLLRGDPLFTSVDANLQAGQELGQSILVVTVKEADPWIANLSVDNYSPPSIGSVRLGSSAGYRDLTGLGDFLTGTYYHTTTSGADVFDFDYTLPLNPMNGTLLLRAAPSYQHVTDSTFSSLNISGNSQLYGISYRQPLIRTSQQEFALSLGFTYEDGQTFTFAGPTPFSIGPDAQGNSRTRTLTFGQDYVYRDYSGAWSLRSLFSFGLDIFNPTINSDSIPDGQFFAWLMQIQRVQNFSRDNSFIMQLQSQLTPNGLLPSQQFVIGGGQSIRGYRQNVRAGDNGFSLTLEDRQTILRDETGTTVMQLAPHFDMGQVWNVDNNPNRLQGQTFLAGLGLGLIWQALPQLNIRVDATLPLINLRDLGNDAQDNGFYFSANYQM